MKLCLPARRSYHTRNNLLASNEVPLPTSTIGRLTTGESSLILFCFLFLTSRKQSIIISLCQAQIAAQQQHATFH